MYAETIRDERTKTTLAIIIYDLGDDPGARFLTEPEHQIQFGVLRHPAGKTIRLHCHVPHPRYVDETSEVLIIRKGSVRLRIGDTPTRTSERVLKAGHVAIIFSGWHSLEILQECEILEVKQGPYQEDKVYLQER